MEFFAELLRIILAIPDCHEVIPLNKQSRLCPLMLFKQVWQCSSQGIQCLAALKLPYDSILVGSLAGLTGRQHPSIVGLEPISQDWRCAGHAYEWLQKPSLAWVQHAYGPLTIDETCEICVCSAHTKRDRLSPVPLRPVFMRVFRTRDQPRGSTSSRSSSTSLKSSPASVRASSRSPSRTKRMFCRPSAMPLPPFMS